MIHNCLFEQFYQPHIQPELLAPITLQWAIPLFQLSLVPQNPFSVLICIANFQDGSCMLLKIVLIKIQICSVWFSICGRMFLAQNFLASTFTCVSISLVGRPNAKKQLGPISDCNIWLSWPNLIRSFYI